MAASGFLWIGTSAGLILIYRIPHLEGVPIVSGKPFLAMDGHKGAVRVLLPVTTKATISSSRVSQFLSDEQRRFSLVSQPDDEEEDEGGALGKNATLTEGNKGGVGILEESGEAGVLLQEITGSVDDTPELEEGNKIDQNELESSLTPPFPLSPPPTAEDDETSHNMTSHNNGHVPADNSEAQYQPLEEEDEMQQIEQVEQDQQVKPATESEEQNGDEANEEIARAEEEDVTPQDEVGKETNLVNGSAEVSVEMEEREKVDGDEPSYEFGEEVATDESKEILGIVRQNGTAETEREAEHLNNGHVDESGIYSAPVELDRIPRPQRAKKEEEENIYAIPHEILPPSVSKRTVVPAGYESPSNLNDKGVCMYVVCVGTPSYHCLFIKVHSGLSFLSSYIYIWVICLGLFVYLSLLMLLLCC